MNPPPALVSRLRTWDVTPFLAVALFTLTLLVFVPAHVYLANQSDVLVFFSDVIISTVALAFALSIVLTGMLVIIPPALRQRITVLILGITFLLWFHAYCLVWSYGVLDGGEIPWGTYTNRTIVDATLWGAVLGPLLWWAPRVYRRARSVCAALLIIQLASLGITSARVYDSPLDFFKYYYVEKGQAFEFSAERNVIVIVLDELQSDIFAETILPNADYRSHFTGFTYFPDTVAGFNFTEFALPAILTGKIYDNSAPRDEFLRQAYLDVSLPAVLKKHGFDVHLYPWRGFANESIYYHETVASNFKQRPRPLVDRLVDVSRVIDLGVFRSMPQFAKPYIYNDAKWRLSDWLTHALGQKRPSQATADSEQARASTEIGPRLTLDNAFLRFARENPPQGIRLTVGTGRNVFKFYHLAGLHVPVKMKRDFTKGIFDYTRANFSEQVEAYAKIMEAFLDALKRLKLYDNSMIIILGDHGSGREPELYTNPGSPQRTVELNQTAAYGDFQRDKARGIPLLLVKRFGEKGELKTSRVPASVVDIPPTVLAELKMASSKVYAVTEQKDFYGVPLFDLHEQQPRTRYYGAMQWAAEKSDYVNPITLYRIQGDSWADDSWSFVKTLDHKK